MLHLCSALEATIVITVTKYSKEAIFKRNDSTFQDIIHYGMPQEFAHTWGNYEAKQDKGQKQHGSLIIKIYSPDTYFLWQGPTLQPQRIALLTWEQLFKRKWVCYGYPGTLCSNYYNSCMIFLISLHSCVAQIFLSLDLVLVSEKCIHISSFHTSTVALS